jgi:hypothetical protein
VGDRPLIFGRRLAEEGQAQASANSLLKLQKIPVSREFEIGRPAAMNGG